MRDKIKENPLKRVGAGEWVTGCVLLAVALAIAYLTSALPFAPGNIPGVGFMPVLYTRLLIVLVILYWLEAGLGKNLRTKRVPGLKELKVPLSFLGVSVGIVLLWEPLGAMLAIFAGALAELMLLEKYALKRSLFVAVILSVGTWVLFEKILGIPLPVGILKGILR